MTSNIFQFLLNFAGALGSMANNLWNLLNETIEIDGANIPVWALVGTGTLIFTIILRLIRSIVL